MAVPNKKDILVGVLLLAGVFLGKASTLKLPYHWDEAGAYARPAYGLSQGSLIRVLPGCHPPETFFGHPPAFYVTLAVVYKMFGASILAAHLLMLGFAFLGVYFTYLLGQWLVGRWGGIMAALFLFACPAFFAQSGMVLADMPLTALGVMSVYFALRNKYLPYLFSAVYMVMAKETGLAVIAAILIYQYLQGRSQPGIFRKLLRYSVPVFVLAFFFVWQTLATGRWCCNPYFESEPLMLTGVMPMIKQGWWLVLWVLVWQGRWLLSGLIILQGVMGRKNGWKSPYSLFLLIILFHILAFTLIFSMNRYLLVVFPYLCVMGAGAVVTLVRHVGRQGLIAALILIVMARGIYGHDKGYSNFEDDMQYQDMIAIHQQVCDYLQAHHPGRRVLAVWPVSSALRDPFLGYVDTPFPVVAPEEPFDILVYIDHPRCGSGALQAIIQGQTVVKEARFERNGKWLEVYRSQAYSEEQAEHR